MCLKSYQFINKSGHGFCCLDKQTLGINLQVIRSLKKSSHSHDSEPLLKSGRSNHDFRNEADRPFVWFKMFHSASSLGTIEAFVVSESVSVLFMMQVTDLKAMSSGLIFIVQEGL